MKLRDYQKSDFKLYKKQSKKYKHILFAGATGYGKSAIIYNLVRKELKKGGRVLIIAPRRKLVKQLTETVDYFSPSVIMGSDGVYSEHADVFVASTPTLHNRLKKHGKKYLKDITLIIIDEAHINFGSTSMAHVTKLYWDKAKWVGLSATPIDAGGYRLEGWDHTIYEHQSKDLIALGWLTQPVVMVAETPDGLDDVGLTGGDYNEGALADLMGEDSRVKNIFSIWETYGSKRKTMIFAVNIAHANIIYEDFISQGVNAAVVHSDLDESLEEESLLDFKHGVVDVVINVGKLTTGFDETSVDCLLIARPTKSLRLFLQIIGRGLRIHKGKDDCLILDVAGVIEQHGYPTMKRDFNKVRPERGEREDPEYKDLECLECGFSTQMRNCRKETVETKHHITKSWYCPNCEAVMKETVEETKEIERLKLVADYTNTDKVNNAEVGEFVYMLARYKGYKEGWAYYISRDYNNNHSYREAVKIIYNKFNAGMIKKDTAVKNINALKYSLS